MRSRSNRGCPIASAATAVVLLSTAFLLPGCIKYSDVLTLQSDGAGTLAVSVAIDRALLETLGGATAATGADSTHGSGAADVDLPTRDEVVANLKATAPAVKLVDYQAIDTERERGLKIEVAFAQLSDAVQMLRGMIAGGPAAASADIELGYDKTSDGSFSYHRSLGAKQEDLAMLSALPTMLAQLQQSGDSTSGPMGSLSDLQVRFETHFPGTVASSNATLVDKGVAVWEFDLTRLMAAASAGKLEMTAAVRP